MKVAFKNFGYFFREVITILKLDSLSNFLSVLSLGFIFFMVSMVISGSLISKEMISSIENEAEISIYYYEDLSRTEVKNMMEGINKISGVRETLSIDENEAKERMTNILGTESRIIELFDHNPFSPYIEVKIDIDNIEPILKDVEKISGIEYVRDNKDILNRLISISNIINILGILIVTAVSISTFVITSHIIRQGIYNNRDQINTLRLLGAPEGFITLPFILEGLILTIGAGALAVVMSRFTLKYIYSEVSGALPFLIFPPIDELIKSIGLISIGLSLLLGLFGSFLGTRGKD